MIDNPAYKGEWSPRMIENPAYKGEWIHPMIDNPDYVDDDSIYAYEDNKFVGFEIWQVKAGTIFDNIIVTDDAEEAEKFAELTRAAQAGEKAASEKEEEAKAATEDEPVDEHEGHDHEKDEL